MESRVPFPGADQHATPTATATKRVLNVHVVPHTHDDVGWLKTVDQYYTGRNDTIQKVSVREILTTVVEALEENPSRTFTYVEQKFFVMWWNEQTELVKDRVRRLVSETKQLTFVNGGWCMHDEAATHYMGMIDQTTLGHDFLKQTFDYVPTVGWQLDPFGHSSAQASLMTYKLGFDALYFGRIDYQDLELRHATRECEGLWNTYKQGSSYGDESDNGSGSGNGRNNDDAEGSVFWGLTGSYSGNYGPPGDYCFDVNCGPDQKSLIDKDQNELVAMVKDFLLAVRQQSDRTKGDHVMLTMGEDFQYQRAAVNFANLDLLIGTVSRMQEEGTLGIQELFGPDYDAVSMFYSSPEYYTNASTSSSVQWSTKWDDFFPYSDCPNCFWTGYFTSRPALKRFERVASSFLLAARQVESTILLSTTTKLLTEQDDSETLGVASCEDPIYRLEDAVGVLQHHDGVSGTSKQHVAYDYAKTLQAGIDGMVPCVIDKLKRMLLGDEMSKKYLTDLAYCQLLNETKCEVSVAATSYRDGNDMPIYFESANDLYVVIYNSLASNRSATIDLPVGMDGHYVVEDIGEGAIETIRALPVRFRSPSSVSHEDASFVVSFLAESLPAVGAKVFRIQRVSEGIESILLRDGGLSMPSAGSEESANQGLTEVSNGYFSVQVDTKTGDIHRIGTQEVDTLSEWGYYTSFDSRKDAIHPEDDHNSGAYIFRPSTPNQKMHSIPAADATVVRTSSGTEIHTRYKEPWIQTTTRIRNKVPYIEIEYQVGPIPIGDGRGKEVVTRYHSAVNNDATFYTDSNGREFLQRKRNYRPTWELTVFEPVAGNYYPVNTAIYIEEQQQTNGDSMTKNSPHSFAVVTDRSQGGGSIVDGTIELMVHRRTLADDYRGVDEAINETDIGITPCPPYGDATRIGEGLVIRGKHRILVENDTSTDEGVGGERLARSVLDESFAEPLVFAGTHPSSETIPFQTTSFSGVSEPLPRNVMLITKRRLSGTQEVPTNDYLIRLGHQYGDPVEVDVSLIFPHQRIDNIHETTLSGNRRIDDWRKERLDWARAGGKKFGHEQESSTTVGATTRVSLSAMDIRTFIVKLK
eukprot:jgi/Psemu1/220670/e_gw1.1054.8.1